MGRVAILGAGPAGSGLAIRLRQLGHQAVLIDRGRPRRRMGESLAPGAWPLLEALGLSGAVAAAGFPRAEAVRLDWGPEPVTRTDPGARAHLVDRTRFDALLREAAVAAGATLLRPASVVARERHPDGWHLTIAGRDEPLVADFLAIATGRAGSGRPLGPRTLALHARVAGADADRPRLWALPGGWLWQLPTGGGTAELVAGVAAGPLAAIRTRLAGMLAVAGTPGALVGPVGLDDATVRAHLRPIEPGLIRLGDAALALDPLAAAGTQKALKEALAAAAVIHTALGRPGDTALAADYWTGMLTAVAERHRGWSAAHAGEALQRHQTSFWRARAGPAIEPPPPPSPADLADRPLHLSPAARLIHAPALEGDFVIRRPAIVHPGLDQPAAFVGTADLPALVARLVPGDTALETARRWTDSMPLPSAVATAAWMVRTGLLVAAQP
jgi:flavin-dependent dehydrogenase